MQTKSNYFPDWTRIAAIFCVLAYFLAPVVGRGYPVVWVLIGLSVTVASVRLRRHDQSVPPFIILGAAMLLRVGFALIFEPSGILRNAVRIVLWGTAFTLMAFSCSKRERHQSCTTAGICISIVAMSMENHYPAMLH